MPRDGAIILCNLIGKLAVLRIECEVKDARLIMRYGIDAKLFEWTDEIAAD